MNIPWKLIGYVAGAIAAMAAIFFVYDLLTASEKTKARLGENQTEAATASGSDAVETTGDQAANEDDVDRDVKGTNDEIDEATDAGGVVDAAFNGLCDNFGICTEE